MLTVTEVAELSGQILDEVERAVIGKREALELVLLGLLADGHVLLEDYPGLAKTLAARSFSQVTSMSFARIQFTPDLMPSDVTGSSVWNQRDGDFDFRAGPIFANIVLADEINRAPPKTQAALLEAMQERQVTIDGVTHVLEPPFLVLATQNPIEYEGTYPLPEAQLDLPVGSRSATRARRQLGVLERLSLTRGRARSRLAETLLELQRALRESISETVGRYMVDLAAATRSAARPSARPRGSLACSSSRAPGDVNARDSSRPTSGSPCCLAPD